MNARIDLARRLGRVLETVTRQSGRLSQMSEYGSELLREVPSSQHRRRVRLQTALTTVIVATNTVGVGVAVLLIGLVFPVPSPVDDAPGWLTFAVVPAYIAAGQLAGTYWITRRTVQALRWSVDGRTPTPVEGRNTFLAPWRVAVAVAALWGVGAVLLAVLYGLADRLFVAQVLFVVGFCGVLAATASYLSVEFVLHPVAAQALAVGKPPRRLAPGILGRIMMVWLVGSGVPVIGIALTALFSLVRQNLTGPEFKVAVLVLASGTLGTGFVLMWLLAWLTAAPVRVVRAALHRVEQGDFRGDLVVFDGTELGQLQHGFNTMVAGLRQRERVRDLFGRHVGRPVAAVAEQHPPRLGGEERHVAAIFVDITESTQLVTTRPAPEIVALLNRFFTVIVDEVDRHHGLINKFQGDATLAMFGAPIHLEQPEHEALAAARTIAERLDHEVPELQAGIGAAAGDVVAGNVGAKARFEYTIIGEPVHTAARLCELAKTEPAGLLAASQMVDAAGEDERTRWRSAKTVTLRGYDRPIRLSAPGTG